MFYNKNVVYTMYSANLRYINSCFQNTDNERQPLWYVFSGMGSQWPGMGRDLLQIPVFSAAVEKCDAVLRPLGVNIWDLLTTSDASVFDNILNCFVGIAAVQVYIFLVLHSFWLLTKVPQILIRMC